MALLSAVTLLISCLCVEARMIGALAPETGIGRLVHGQAQVLRNAPHIQSYLPRPVTVSLSRSVLVAPLALPVVEETHVRVAIPPLPEPVIAVSAPEPLLFTGENLAATKGESSPGVLSSVRRVLDRPRRGRNWGRVFDGEGASFGTVFSAQPSRFAKVLRVSRAKSGLIEAAVREAERQGVDPLLVLAMIKQESNFNIFAHSGAGAKGLLQLMPATSLDMGVLPEDLYDAEANLRAGVRYIKRMWGTFSDISFDQLSTVDPFSRGDVKAAIAAYNAGPGAVRKYKGIPPFRETQDYVLKVLGYYQSLRERAGRLG